MRLYLRICVYHSLCYNTINELRNNVSKKGAIEIDWVGMSSGVLEDWVGVLASASEACGLIGETDGDRKQGGENAAI